MERRRRRILIHSHELASTGDDAGSGGETEEETVTGRKSSHRETPRTRGLAVLHWRPIKESERQAPQPDRCDLRPVAQLASDVEQLRLWYQNPGHVHHTCKK